MNIWKRKFMFPAVCLSGIERVCRIALCSTQLVKRSTWHCVIRLENTNAARLWQSLSYLKSVISYILNLIYRAVPAKYFG